MHVDVDFVVGHLQKKQRRGKNCRRQDVAIGLVNSVENQPVAHQPTVHENVDSIAIHPLYVWARRKSTYRQRCFFFLRLECWLGDGRAEGSRNRWNFDQLFQRLPSEELIHAVGQLFRGRTVNDFLCRRRENKLLRWIRQRVMRDQRSDVAQLRGVRLEKFPARGNTVKNVGDVDGCSRRQPRRLYVNQFAPREFDARAFSFRFVARFKQQSRYRRDRRQRFPAKPQRGNREQVVRRAQLARGMAFERQQRVVVRHPVTVVDHANHALAADFHFDANGLRARVDGVLQQLFHHRCRALDNLARGDFIRHCFRQYAYSAHFSLIAIPSWSSCSLSTLDGESAIKSWAAVVFAKAITSRMDFSPARSMTTRSMPRAMPPCGGVP